MNTTWAQYCNRPGFRYCMNVFDNVVEPLVLVVGTFGLGGVHNVNDGTIITFFEDSRDAGKYRAT